MSEFIKENFLLDSTLAEKLYYDIGKDLPIIDYHNHLSPQLIHENHQFTDLTSIWLDGDHYKWRAMRTLGIKEKYITGNASAKEKFLKWAETVPQTLRNPLYHWTHMELKNPFGINKLLNPKSAIEIFDNANDILQTPPFRTQALLKQFNVEMLGTTDDPTSQLEYHKALINNNSSFKVKPTFRPDNIFQLTDGDTFRDYINNLGSLIGIKINDLETLEEVLSLRIDYFDNLGCVASDHGMTQIPIKSDYSKSEVNLAFKQVISGHDNQAMQYKESYCYYLLLFLCKKYFEKNWVQQFHLGSIRNTNSQKFAQLGPNTGYDSIGDYPQAERLAYFFNKLEVKQKLSKTIIYNINPADNAAFASMIGNFQSEGIRGKIQFGSAWWHLDQLEGITEQINTLSNLNLISCFIGMTTDSRSFLSYSRHEYFRRLVCNIFANDINKGLLPDDIDLTKETLEKIFYSNAKSFFKN